MVNKQKLMLASVKSHATCKGLFPSNFLKIVCTKIMNNIIAKVDKTYFKFFFKNLMKRKTTFISNGSCIYHMQRSHKPN